MIVFSLRKSFLFVEKVIFFFVVVFVVVIVVVIVVVMIFIVFCLRKSFLFVKKIFPQTNTINSMDRAQKNKQGLCWSS